MTAPIPVLTWFSLDWATVPHRLATLGFCACHPTNSAPLPLVISGRAGRTHDELLALAAKQLGDWEKLSSRPDRSEVVSLARPGNIEDCPRTEGQQRHLSDFVRASVLPTIQLCGIGARTKAANGEDQLVHPPMEHIVRVPRTHLADFSDTELREARLLLRGFCVVAIGNRRSGWTTQGSHLQKLHVGAKIKDIDTREVTLDVGAGFQGGHADDADPAQRWSGGDGYLMSLHLVAVTGDARDEVATVRVSKGADQHVGADTFATMLDSTQTGGMSRLEIEVEAMKLNGDEEPDEGRLLKRLVVDMSDHLMLKAEFSNGKGAAALPFSGTVRVTRSSFRPAYSPGFV